MYSAVLLHCEKLANSLDIGALHDCGVVQHTFALFALLGENVAVVSVFSLDFSCSGESESLLTAGISLYLWHCSKKFSCCSLPRHVVPTVSIYFCLFSASLTRLRRPLPPSALLRPRPWGHRQAWERLRAWLPSCRSWA